MPIYRGSTLLHLGGEADTSDATAAAADIATGKTAYIASGKVTGTLVVLDPYSIVVDSFVTFTDGATWVTVSEV